MSCQSLAPARAFAEPDKDSMAHCGNFQRSVRFSSESQSSHRASTDSDCRRETPGSISLTALMVTPTSSQQHVTSYSMSQSAPSASSAFGDLSDAVAPPLPSSVCRFPKLEECAHFHYERVSLGGLRVEIVRSGSVGEAWAAHGGDSSSVADSDLSEGWVCLKVRSHVNDSGEAEASQSLNASWTEQSAGVSSCEWSLTRSAENFLQLDNMLHRCIYDRKVSNLLNLAEDLTADILEDRIAYQSLVADYVHHLSIIADDSINCGPILNWLQMDNKGHRLLVANEDSSSINTPAVAAAYSVRKYISQARDEISFDVGDMISIIDMPGPQESIWWRGKRGFRVGFFPHHCVAVIGDKVPRHMSQPPPIVGSVAVAPIKPVLRKHGKLISLFRSFILSRPSRRTLKQQGILRERVFGCDLGEHLLNCGHDVPLVLVECASVIEEHGIVDGIYRLSGGSGLTQRLRAQFDEGRAPDLSAPAVLQDVHAVSSLLKMYFRELPNPLCTYQLYEGFVGAVQPGPEDATRLRRMRDTVVKLPPPHYRTLSYLMRHLRRVSLLGAATGMTARNMAIVWAPNLLRSPRSQHALQGVAVQAVVTEFLICYAEELFAEQQGEDRSEEHDDPEPTVELRGCETTRRPKSLPLNTPTKLLSLEEARQRGGAPTTAISLPPPSGAIAAAAAANTLRPSTHLQPKYIEVGSGPNNLPQYHTVLELPAQGPKRGLKRSPSGWRGLFFKNKQQRPQGHRALSIQHPQAPADPQTQSCLQLVPLPIDTKDIAMSGSPLRPVKSCESLQSETDTLGPLSERTGQPVKQHTRSASCDSYFEPWQAELADMRLRLSPQERDNNIFSEEDDTTLNVANGGLLAGSLCSSPAASDGCSAEPSPRRLRLNTSLKPAPVPDVDAINRKRSKLEEQLSSIGYIDSTDSPVRLKPGPEKRHSDEWPSPPHQQDDAKRLCKDCDSPLASLVDTFQTNGTVKLRERSSPRKAKGNLRYSGMHHPLTNLPSDDAKIITIVNPQPSRVTWHGVKDSHSTLIKIDWPIENTSVNSLTASTLNSSPITPMTPIYDPLESDSEASECVTNKHTIKIANDNNDSSCNSCENEKKCLKCELTECDKEIEYNSVKTNFKVALPVTKQFSLSNDEHNRLSLHDSLEGSPVNSSPNISYQNLNRLSNISTNSSNSEPNSNRKDNAYENVALDHAVDKRMSVMTSSHESSSSYSNASPLKPSDELYECFSFNRPNYINLQSTSTTSKSSSASPLKSPLRSTISITFKSPTKSKNNDYELIETPTNACERDSVYEDIDLEKNLSIVEDASVPDVDASLPTQQACQPASFTDNLIILETPTEPAESSDSQKDNLIDIYNQVKFFKKSIDEVNAMMLGSPETEKSENSKSEHKNNEESNGAHYENVQFSSEIVDISNAYENVMLDNSVTLLDEEQKDDCNSEPLIPQLCLDRRVIEDNETPESSLDSVDTVEEDKMNIDGANFEKPKLSLAVLSAPKTDKIFEEMENGNLPKNKTVTINLNVRQLANRFESPTEQKGPFSFDKSVKLEVKYPSLEKKKDTPVSTIDRARSLCDARPKKELTLRIPPPISPKTYKLSKNSVNARSLDENAFVKEFGCGNKKYVDRRKSLEVRETKKHGKFLPDLNLNMEESNEDKLQEIMKNYPQEPSITPTTENKISLVQARFSTKDYAARSPSDMTEAKSLTLNFDTDKKLSRERIEKYKEERRNFLREKYSSQSFRSSSPADAHLTRLKAKRQDENEKPKNLSSEKMDSVELRNPEKYERLFEKTNDEILPKFERRNTVDLGQRMRFSLTRSVNNLDNIPSRRSEFDSRSGPEGSPGESSGSGRKNDDGLSKGRFQESGRKAESAGRSSGGHFERKDKMSPSYNIKDMAAMFEQKSQNNTG